MIKIKIGMVDLKSFTDGECTKMIMIDKEYDDHYIVYWGKNVKLKGRNVTPNGCLVKKERVYNITEREISKFKYWCYRYWDNNFY